MKAYFYEKRKRYFLKIRIGSLPFESADEFRSPTGSRSRRRSVLRASARSDRANEDRQRDLRREHERRFADFQSSEPLIEPRNGRVRIDQQGASGHIDRPFNRRLKQSPSHTLPFRWRIDEQAFEQDQAAITGRPDGDRPGRLAVAVLRNE